MSSQELRGWVETGEIEASETKRGLVLPREGRAVDAVLASELLGFVSAEAAWLSREIPGFDAAMRWPAPTKPV